MNKEVEDTEEFCSCGMQPYCFGGSQCSLYLYEENENLDEIKENEK